VLFNIKTKLGDAVEGLKQDHKVKHLLRARARARYTLVDINSMTHICGGTTQLKLSQAD